MFCVHLTSPVLAVWASKTDKTFPSTLSPRLALPLHVKCQTSLGAASLRDSSESTKRTDWSLWPSRAFVEHEEVAFHEWLCGVWCDSTDSFSASYFARRLGGAAQRNAHISSSTPEAAETCLINFSFSFAFLSFDLFTFFFVCLRTLGSLGSSSSRPHRVGWEQLIDFPEKMPLSHLTSSSFVEHMESRFFGQLRRR
jgi:hypothetical protein